MSIDLTKGQRIDLTKTNPQTRFVVGLGWEPRTTEGSAFDLDASAFILSADGKMLSNEHFVFYNNKTSPNAFVTHNGDNTTGIGAGDDEILTLDLTKATEAEQRVAFVVTIHEAEERGQNFGQVGGCYIRVLSEDGTEIMRYDLGEDFSTEKAVEFGAIYRHGTEWKFEAKGQGFAGGLNEFLTKYN